MNCSVCGAMIPDGQATCPVCGAMQQPQGQPMYQQPQGQPMYQQPQGQPMYQQPQGQPMYQQPQGQPMYQQSQGQPMYQQPQGQPMYQMPQGQPMYQQPQMASDGIGGYFSSLTGNIMNLVRAIGALILLISPILPWAKVSFFGMKESANMFKIGGIEVFFAIMIALFAVVVVLWDMADHVPALGNIKAKLAGIPFMELIIAGVLLLFVLFGTIKSTAGTYGLAKKAIGVWIAWIGVVAVAVPGVMKLVKK